MSCLFVDRLSHLDLNNGTIQHSAHESTPKAKVILVKAYQDVEFL